MILVSINQCEISQGGKRVVIKPGTPFEIDDVEGAKLKNLRAARDASEAELALHKQNVAAQAAVAKAKTQVKPVKASPGKSAADDGSDEGEDDL